MNVIDKDHIFNRVAKLAGPYQLAVLRIAIGGQITYAVQSKIFPMMSLIEDRQSVKTIFPTALDNLIATSLVGPLIWICTIAGIFMVLGLFTRYILPLLTLSFILLYSFYYVSVDAPIQWLYFWFPLVVLCFSKSSGALSIDALISKRKADPSQDYRWPLEICSVWFVYIYFSAGLAKVFPILKGVSWVYGTTSKDIIYHRFLDSPLYYIFGKPFFDYSEATAIFSFLSMSAVVLELSTILILFTSRFHLVILLLLLSMHFFLFLTGVAGFMQTALILGICLMPHKWFNWGQKQVSVLG